MGPLPRPRWACHRFDLADELDVSDITQRHIGYSINGAITLIQVNLFLQRLSKPHFGLTRINQALAMIDALYF